jgi:glycosyltransferase involved in cell wall biosynthesis
MDTPLVSIITPCFNDGKYILECIEAVKASDYPCIEHIIIDDGSTDAYTLDVLNSLSTLDVQIIRSKNQGVCKARQQAILASAGKYILPIDADDLISKSYISLAVSALEQNDEIKLAVTDYQLFGKRSKLIQLESYSLERLLGHNLFINSSLFRRVDFDRVNGYNVSMNQGLEDWDFWINILKDGGEVKKIEGVHFFYRIKEKSKSRNAMIDEEHHCLLRKQIWENHREVFSRVFLSPLDTFEYLRVARSKEYKLGSFLLKFVRKVLRK